MPPKAKNKDIQNKWPFIIFSLLILIIVIFMLKPYFAALFTAALIAYLIYPLSKRLQKLVKKRILVEVILSIFSVILLLTLTLGLITPVVLQATELYESYNVNIYFIDECSSNESNFVCNLITKTLGVTGAENLSTIIASSFQKFAGNIASSIGSLFSVAASFVTFIVITILAIFYFLEHGELIKKQLLEILPLKETNKEKIFKRLKETLNAVVKGNIITALLQGFFGGVIFFILGIPLAFFWAAVMVIAAFIPAVGPALIFVPAALYLIAIDSWVKAIVLLSFCFVALGYIDNVLKPKMIGDKIKLSSFVIFLGVLGGLQLFGILGLFFGPILIALLVTCKDIYQKM